MICGKCKIILVSKISFDLVEKIKNNNKNRTRASLFQSSEDGKQKKFLCGLNGTHLENTLCPPKYRVDKNRPSVVGLILVIFVFEECYDTSDRR